METQKYSLNSDFDIELHKENFTNYLEVIILPSGKIEYAVPSHQEKLIHLGMAIFKEDRPKFENRCPSEYWGNYMTWLCKVTECVAVWNDGYVGTPNRFQKLAINRLVREGLIQWKQ